MVRQVPDYARQYLIEHPELGPPLDLKNKNNDPCGAGALAREGQHEEPASAITSQQNDSPASATVESAAERQKNAAHGASRGSTVENDSAPKERKNNREPSSGNPPPAQDRKERAKAAIKGAERGNWRDLRTVFEFAGITEQSKEAPS
jgi:hypothetical protein